MGSRVDDPDRTGRPAVTATPDSASATAPRPLWRNRDFALLWSGAAFSILGMRVTSIAWPLLVIFDGGSAERAGLVGFAALLPQLLVQLPAGVLVDRWDRKKVMICSDLTGLTAIASVLAALLIWQLTLPHLLIAAFLAGSASVCYQLSERAAVRAVVDPSHLSAALSQNEARSKGAGLLGQPISTVLLSFASWMPFGVTVIGHALSIATLLAIRTPFQQVRRRRRASLGSELAAGLRWMRDQKLLRSALVLISCTNIISQVLALAMILIIKESGGAVTTIGLIGVATGVGGLLGALCGSWFMARFGLSTLFVGTLVLRMLLIPSIAFFSEPWVLAAVFAAMSWAGGLMNVVGGVYQVRITPEEMQGRAASVGSLITSGANSLGPLTGGLLLGAWGTSVTVLGAAVTMAALAVLAAVAARRFGVPAQGREWQAE
ncbi:MFS transporter [Kribbella sp. CA-293567]|uniref:MFS transporter n=1 Tax=Kribbella sp. CA-293567 TaxID=3002436 RepID=UPI0022DDA5A8|nr:MFS transporter [Kribbella sp. CA-293567]WBQ08266.1 MFS transporter [Kribbella sp. CA-293567]